MSGIRTLRLATVLVLLLPAAAARAGTVELVGPPDVYLPGETVRFTAGAGEANRVTLVANSETQVTVLDQGAPLTAGAGCTSLTPHRARCTDPYRVVAGDVALGDADDRTRIVVPAGRPWGSLDVSGGPGSDRVELREVRDVHHPRGNFPNASASGGAGDDTILGGPQADQLLAGDGGADRISGRGGNDTIDAGHGADRMNGGPGKDTVDYSKRTAPVRVDLAHPGNAGRRGEHDHLARIEDAIGGAGHDVLLGNGRDNLLRGSNTFFEPGPGDTIRGRGGNDVLIDYGGRSRLDGGTGRDEIAGPGPGDRTTCASGNDLMSGATARTFLPRDCERIDQSFYRYTHGAVRGTRVKLRTRVNSPGGGVCVVNLRLTSPGGVLYGQVTFRGRRRLSMPLTKAGRAAAAAHRIAQYNAIERGCADTQSRWRVRL
jgi:RTX calcium-binding nonapeptide repeat (4 copies)